MLWRSDSDTVRVRTYPAPFQGYETDPPRVKQSHSAQVMKDVAALLK
jgi:hypothetical protein